jgi:hypothetical protein
MGPLSIPPEPDFDHPFYLAQRGPRSSPAVRTPPVIYPPQEDKFEALPSSELWRFAAAHAPPTVSRLLVIRSTATNREIVRLHEALLHAASPARTAAARAALTGTAPWPGHAVLWAEIRNGTAAMLDGPPRRIGLGR